jgi:uncharacterized damage-inducible protein DinB
MNEPQRICRQIEQMVYGEAWHGPCLVDVLQGVDAKKASAKPIPTLHSIWELLGHLTATQRIILERIETGGDSGIEWLDVPTPTEDAWQNAVAGFKDAEARLRQAIAAFPEDRLELPLKPGGTTAYNNFHGNVQHLAYHIGQMAILNKARELLGS